MSRSAFSVLFYANKSKVKNGTVPVMGRITINGTQSQFSCKRSIPLSLWDSKGNCASQTLNYSGWLHSNEYRRNALANNVTAQVIMDEKRNLFLHINETPIAQWLKEQFGLGQVQWRDIRV